MKKYIIILFSIMAIGKLYAHDSGIIRREIGKVSKISAGSNITISPSNGVGDVSISATGGGGTVYQTTYAVILDGGDGDIFYASSTFRSGATGVFTVGKSTCHIVDFMCYVINRSTMISNYKLAYSTGGSGSSVLNSYLAEVSIPADVTRSSWTVPSITTLYPEQSLTIHITNVQTGGYLPNGFSAILRYWRENENN